jgi:hypothetical protein
MDKYNSEAEREAAIAAGETTRRGSTLQDGAKHYAMVRYFHDGDSEIARNLTGTEFDDLDTALDLTRSRDFGPHAPCVAGYGIERIS